MFEHTEIASDWTVYSCVVDRANNHTFPLIEFKVGTEEEALKKMEEIEVVAKKTLLKNQECWILGARNEGV